MVTDRLRASPSVARAAGVAPPAGEGLVLETPRSVRHATFEVVLQTNRDRCWEAAPSPIFCT